MVSDPEIIATLDSSDTMRHPVLGELYHSSNGALAESEHIFIRNGLEAVTKHKIRIFEMGFGTGLNAYLTMKYATDYGLDIDYTAIEKFPVSVSAALKLSYAADMPFAALHRLPWGTRQKINDNFFLTKIEGDLAGFEFGTTFDLVYYDAFSPECQPELWTEDIFRKIFCRLSQDGILVTYSAKGEVKRSLRAAGFTVERLAGAPGKRHMVRARKI